MAVKFSEFTPATIASNVEFIVGYTSTGNLNQQIPPANLNTTYSFTTITDPGDAANVDLVLTGAQPNVTNTTESIQFTAGTAIALTAGTDEITITNNGVTSFTNTNGTFISAATANSAATGAVTTGVIDLSAGTPSSPATQFLRGDNTWSVPTDVANTYTLPITGTASAVTATLTGSAGDTDPVLITAGNEISFSSITTAGFTIDSTAAGDTYTLSAGAKAGSSVPLNLDATAGSDSLVNLTGGTGISVDQTSGTEITISNTAATTIIKNQFTGNNSTTAFTLTVGVSSATSINIFISGVYQNSVDSTGVANYSVSGATLTFVTAPPTTAAKGIEVIITQ
tara:strand:- start:2 stop:1021 length:1020 start_codon:yes stop_codon:yes gene_type:complete